MIEKKKIQQQKTVLVGLVTAEQTEQQLNEYLDELAFLSSTACVTAVKRYTQKLPHPDSRTFVGKGKLEEIKNYLQSHKDVDMVVETVTRAGITAKVARLKPLVVIKG